MRNGAWRAAPAMQSTHSARRCCCARGTSRVVLARLRNALTASFDAITAVFVVCPFEKSMRTNRTLAVGDIAACRSTVRFGDQLDALRETGLFKLVCSARKDSLKCTKDLRWAPARKKQVRKVSRHTDTRVSKKSM